MYEEEFIKVVVTLAGCGRGEAESIIPFIRNVKICAGEFYLRAGEIPRTFAFVANGLFRYYYVDKKGNDYTKGFFPERSIITAYSALINKRESYFTIEALENSDILVIDYESWKQTVADSVCWQKFLIALLERGYCTKEARERELLLFSAGERYKSFLKQFPGLEPRIKQHYIASYLGINPVSLSRIRKKIRELT